MKQKFYNVLNSHVQGKFLAIAAKLGLALAVVLGLLSMASPALASGPYVVSAKITGPNTVTILYGAPVNTTAADYTNLGGALAGKNIVSISGSGTASVSLTVDGSAMATNAGGSLNIGTTLTGVSDGAPYAGGNVNVADGQVPALSSFMVTSTSNNPSSSLAKIGDTVSLTFTASETITNPTVGIDGHVVTANGSGMGPYTASYALMAGDAQGQASFSLIFTDLAGNTAPQVKGTLYLNGSSSATSSGTAPVISSITSNANSSGVLNNGGTIVFTLTPIVADANLKVNGYYNTVPLSWATTNGGATYTATYTVSPGNNSQTTPLQISGVTVTDSLGNISQSASGSDVQKTISVSAVNAAPVIAQVSAVTDPSTTATPSYTFSSTAAGTINFSGDCSSASKTAVAGSNTVTFSTLADGAHNNCTITVTDSSGNVSNTLFIPGFTVSTGSAAPATTATAPAVPTASSSGNYQFTKFLKKGMSGQEVLELQNRLAALGYLTATPNGYFGSATQAAVKAFQKANGLDQFGYVGPGTRAALNK